MSTSKVPKLPLTGDGEANSIRYEVNPAIALKALTDIYKQVQQYQIQLRQLAHKIHQIYAEGPVVSGWLASEASLNAAVKYSHHSDPGQELHTKAQTKPAKTLEAMDVALFRHGDANDLMNYLSALESAMLEESVSGAPLVKESQVKESQSSPLVNDSPNNGLHSDLNSGQNNGSSQYYLCRLASTGQLQAEP
ncbi:MAG: hypothetical protein AAGF93_14010, partial [Cyanobacteria bacterium P01_H01_bin.105]